MSTLRDARHGVRRARERGAVLVTGLVILAVMTIIGVGSMRTLVLNERMAGNLYDQHAAFQAAEAGAQAALTYITGQTAPIVATASGTYKVWPGCTLADGAAPTCSAAGAGSHPCCRLQVVLEDWESGTPTEGIVLDGFGGSPLSSISAAYQPRVHIESRYIAPLDVEAAARGAGVHFYTVTAVGAGPSENTRALLQTTIPRVYAW
jgi:type IV pilus assembly protein PilX